MDDPIATDVEIEFDATPETVLELTDEWIAYLDDLQPPALIAGIDPNIRYLPDNDTRMA